MKLATLRGSKPSDRNGRLIIVSTDLKRGCFPATGLPLTLIDALWVWDEVKDSLENQSRRLNDGRADSFALNLEDCAAPLPHCGGFYDGSAFLSHVVRARKARGDVMPESAKVTPLMYQGVSDNLLAWNAPISIIDTAFGGDFEGEFGVITSAVPRGTRPAGAAPCIALITLFNDITLREIVKTELETKFGFLQSKPNSSFAPVVVTPNELCELGGAPHAASPKSFWVDGRVHLDLQVYLNEKSFGHPNGREMHFSFEQLLAHAARTRPLSPGTIIGAGTVSNENQEVGFACLTEKRFQEILDGGSAVTPWLKPGDRVRIDVVHAGQSIFGSIDELVTL